MTAGQSRTWAALRWSAALTLLFLATYGFTNAWAAQRAARLRLYFDWELALPFVPWMIYVYLSVNGLLLLPLGVVDAAGVRRYAQAFALATALAAACHLILPAELGWTRPAAVPGHPVFTSLYALDRPHNLVPSLHVTYSALAALVVGFSRGRSWLKALAAVWLGLLITSALLVHQHHVADVVGGLALAAGCSRWLALHSRNL